MARACSAHSCAAAAWSPTLSRNDSHPSLHVPLVDAVSSTVCVLCVHASRACGKTMAGRRTRSNEHVCAITAATARCMQRGTAAVCADAQPMCHPLRPQAGHEQVAVGSGSTRCAAPLAAGSLMRLRALLCQAYSDALYQWSTEPFVRAALGWPVAELCRWPGARPWRVAAFGFH